MKQLYITYQVKPINIFLMVLFIIMISCSENILDEIDNNPNNPEEVPVQSLIPNVTSGVPYYLEASDIAWYSSVFSEHNAGTNGRMYELDLRSGINSKLSENAWLNLYASTLKNLKTIIDRVSEGGAEEGNYQYKGIAQVLYAYTFSAATDLFGRIPYSEALKGKENRQPKYDKQEDIYNDLQKILDSAIVNLSKSSIQTPGEEDFIYEGNTDMWIKASWALKARLYNHLSKRDAQNSAINALQCLQNAFESKSDEMVFDKWSSSEDISHQNPWYRMRNAFSISKTLYDLLNNNSDPRKSKMITIAYDSNAYVPALNGDAELDVNSSKYSNISYNVLQPNTPIPLISYVEILFIKAECNLRLGNYDVAFMAYQQAISQDLQDYGMSIESALNNDVFFDNVLAMAPQNLTLEDIITQKFIALWPFQSIEVYTDWRRTGIPSLQNPLGEPPRRFPYPQNEISTNGNNVPDVQLTEGVWWDDGTED
ncbi:MAG: SusD/RagB family nutrient-binding outer membrane lipoprotein [Bacteroidota bacterium]